METKKEVNKYRLPCLAKLSVSVATFGTLFLFLSVGIFFYKDIGIFNEAVTGKNPIEFLIAIFNRMVATAPLVFTALSVTITSLALTAIDFSKKEQNTDLEKATNSSLCLSLLPMIALYFDKDVINGNAMYIVTALFFYIFVICYLGLLLWYMKNHNNVNE